jgi:cobalt/nickel transport system ATP-binding protein
MIQLSDIRFNYNSQDVLNGLNLHVHPGDRIGLIGANGSGKTTLCKIIMGLVKPQSGTVKIFDRIRAVESDFTEVRRRIGFVFQDADDQLFCPTVLEDVAFGPLNQGKSVQEAKRIVANTLESLQLTGFEERFSHQLSGGEKRLVSLATVLAMEPEALILDEPTSGLDEKATETLAEVLTRSDLTMIVVSHDKDFVERITSTQMAIRNGVIDHPRSLPNICS